MSEPNLGGVYLNVKARGLDEALEKLNKISELLKEANTLKDELASTEITVNFLPSDQEQLQEDS